jgi:hypothetical protein
MPQFGSHLTGPIRHTTKYRDQSNRAWFQNLPVGMNDPDFVNDFIDFTKAGQYSTTDYTLSSSANGSLSTAAVNTSGTNNIGSSAQSVNGALLLQTGSTAGNFTNVQNKVLAWILDRSLVPNIHSLQSAKQLWFEAAFSADLSNSDVDCFVGLSEIQNSIIGSAGLSQNYIGFRVTNGAATLAMVASTAGSVSKLTTSVGSGNSNSIALGTLTRVGFVFSGSNNVDFYVNRNYMNSLQITNLPTSPMAVAFQICTNSAVNRSMVVDYVYCSKVR